MLDVDGGFSELINAGRDRLAFSRRRLYTFDAGIVACSRPAGAILDFKELEWA